MTSLATKVDRPASVLTIAATFPSLIQPWLVNQLVQVIKNGGTNTVVARRAEASVYSSDIDRYDLMSRYQLIPSDHLGLVKSLLSSFTSVSGVMSFFSGLRKFPRILAKSELSISEKLFSVFLLPVIGNGDVNLIHSHSEMAGNRFIPIVYALNIPLVITFHGLPPVGVNPITREQRRRYTEAASVILVNTGFAKRQYQSLGVDGGKIEILPQGTNLIDFPFRIRPFPCDGVVCILTVGRFHPDKGQKYAIEAVASLITQGLKIKYRLVGNGPERNALEALCEDLGISPYVEFYSGLSDQELREMYSNSHIFILPSLKSEDGFHEETQGVVLQEAQAVGLIIIATKTGGIPECIDDGVSGFLVDDRSSSAIAQKLTDVISRPDSWAEYQLAGRSWVEKHYDIDVIGAKINLVYRTLISSREARF